MADYNDEEEIVEEVEDTKLPSVSINIPYSSFSSAQFLSSTDGLNIDFNQRLILYYRHFFPFDLLYNWLSYGNESIFKNREFAFWNSSDFFTRYQCFENEEHFRTILTQPFQSHSDSSVIERMEIGPIYRKPPNQHMTPGVVPVSREFVIDIDMNDFNGVRTCCQNTDVCSFCWVFMIIAIKVIDSILRIQYGFKRLLWVFSGRRGVHCWVCDPHAKLLSQEDRTSIIKYMSQPTYPFSPHISDIYNNILIHYFETRLLPEQKLLNHPGTSEDIFKRLPKSVATALREAWMNDAHDSCYRWAQLKKSYAASKLTCFNAKIQEIVVHYTYPRFDVHVSESLNHLLKSPFCVHPKSGFVSIPIDPLLCDEFDPFKTAPSLVGLITQNKHDLILFQNAKEHFYKSFLLPFF